MSSHYSAWSDFLNNDGIEGWVIKSLGELFTHRKDKGHPELPLLAITGSGGVVPRDSLTRRDTSNVDKSKYLRVLPNDIAYNTMRMWQGVSGISEYEGIVSPAYTICAPKADIEPEYAKQLFKLPLLIQVFHRQSQGLVDDTLNLKFSNFSPIRACIPPVPEQRKITSILTSVDDVIEKTESQIAKLHDLKTGMMQELLSKGIGHAEFKDSPVGRVPVEWDVKRLSEIGSFKNGINKSSEDFGFGTPFLNISDAYQDELDTSKLGRLNASEKEILDYGLKKGDVIFVRSSVKPLGVGFPIMFKSNTEPTVFCGFMIRFRMTSEEIIPSFLVHYFRNEKSRSEVMKVATISANTNINQSALSNLLVAIPPIEEQESIVKYLDSVTNRVHNHEKVLGKCRAVKKALMQDLLTGSVRVKTD